MLLMISAQIASQFEHIVILYEIYTIKCTALSR